MTSAPVGNSDANFMLYNGNSRAEAYFEAKKPNIPFQKKFTFRYITITPKFIDIEMILGVCGAETLSSGQDFITVSR